MISRGGRCEVFVRAPIGNGKAARVFLGDDFTLGADQVDAISGIAGLTVHNLARMEAKSDGYRTRHRRSAMRLVG